MSCERSMWNVEETCNRLLSESSHNDDCNSLCVDTCDIYLASYALDVLRRYPEQRIQPVARCYYEPVCQTCVDYIHGKVQ